jgi:mono/diheme cytochrome c family protein
MMRAPRLVILYFTCYLIIKVLAAIQVDSKNGSESIAIVPEIGSNENQGPQLTVNQLYAKQCLTCHQANGGGVPGMFPPLAGNAKITGPSSDLIRIVLFGLKGPVTVNGKDYNQLMPAQGYLSDKQIAELLTYIRSSWGNKASSVSAEEVGKIRKQGKPKIN